MKKAVVIGSTGLVGKELVKQLLKDNRYESIIVISRRPYPIKDPKLIEVVIPDFDQLHAYRDQLKGHDYYCALGTTIKTAGSKEAFLKVDVEYPLAFAKVAQSHEDFRQFLIVTSVGANSSSPLFYNRAKGMVEDELKKLNLRGLKIFQPSLLLGEREEFRFLEEVAKVVSRILTFFVIGSKKRVGAIRASEVARAMIKVAHEDKEGYERFTPGKMIDIVYS